LHTVQMLPELHVLQLEGQDEQAPLERKNPGTQEVQVVASEHVLQLAVEHWVQT